MHSEVIARAFSLYLIKCIIENTNVDITKKANAKLINTGTSVILAKVQTAIKSQKLILVAFQTNKDLFKVFIVPSPFQL